MGSYHVLALTMDGAIWTFGLNRFGQVIIPGWCLGCGSTWWSTRVSFPLKSAGYVTKLRGSNSAIIPTAAEF